MSGMASAGNSMSTTGPMTRATRPTPSGCSASFAAGAFLAGALAVLAVGVMVSRFRSRGRRERSCARDDLADFLGDLRLARRVGEPGVLTNDVFGVGHGGVH